MEGGGPGGGGSVARSMGVGIKGRDLDRVHQTYLFSTLYAPTIPQPFYAAMLPNLTAAALPQARLHRDLLQPGGSHAPQLPAAAHPLPAAHPPHQPSLSRGSCRRHGQTPGGGGQTGAAGGPAAAAAGEEGGVSAVGGCDGVCCGCDAGWQGAVSRGPPLLHWWVAGREWKREGIWTSTCTDMAKGLPGLAPSVLSGCVWQRCGQGQAAAALLCECRVATTQHCLGNRSPVPFSSMSCALNQLVSPCPPTPPAPPPNPPHTPHTPPGHYWGSISSDACGEAVEAADLVLVAGAVWTDYSTLGYSHLLPADKTVEMGVDGVTLRGGAHFGCIGMEVSQGGGRGGGKRVGRNRFVSDHNAMSTPGTVACMRKSKSSSMHDQAAPLRCQLRLCGVVYLQSMHSTTPSSPPTQHP
jgi:hypothetical protein